MTMLRQQGSTGMRLTLLVLFTVLANASSVVAQVDKSADLKALPKVPPEFEITVFASEPLVRQPCSMAFDARGRLFVGMGPQYRNPTPETPGDSVMIVLDTDGDGRADRTTEFATGFNAIQGLTWHGSDLWIANAPDLTVIRDRDGDDEADEYIKVYTDLGNLEHGLHGLNWAPDGKLYMSKGNSKGLNQPGRYAPKPFRELWGITAPAQTPDFPAPIKTNKNDYRRAYHQPADDWGLDGGVLRCDDGGHNLEIIARGFRNPWDIALDSGFNWLGTDNDQTTGDRVFMPFYGAHFGWNHPWSSHWSTAPHAPTAPVSGPLFEGSGTGVVFCMSPQFPPEYRGAFLVNDWLRKATYLWRPQWDGALLRPAGGDFTTFIEGGSSLFRPTDLEFGPDGALWVLGWSSGYGAEWKDGQLANEGRVFRIAWKHASPRAKPPNPQTVDELIDELDSPLPVRRTNAQDELVRRGNSILPRLFQRLADGTLSENQETWTVWTAARLPAIEPFATELAAMLTRETAARDAANRETAGRETAARETAARDAATRGGGVSLNLQVQAVRIFAYQARQFGQTERLADVLRGGLRHSQPRVRFAAVQAIHETRQASRIPDRLIPDLVLPELRELLPRETDSTVFYSAWQALRAWHSPAELRTLLSDSRGAVRRAALLGLLETHAATVAEVRTISDVDKDAEVRRVADLWLLKAAGGSKPEIRGRALEAASTPLSPSAPDIAPAPAMAPLVRNLKARSGAPYKVVPGGFAVGSFAYTDRGYRLASVPAELAGADLIQTANEDDGSKGAAWLTFDAILPIRVWIGLDRRQPQPPEWLRNGFEPAPLTATIDEGARFAFYSRAYAAGNIELGGNSDDGRPGGKGNYLVVIAPQTLAKQPMKASVEAVLAMLERGDRDRGELLFRHSHGVGCAKCHSLTQTRNGFGPNLAGLGLRANARHIVQSIVEPSAVITEGFNQLTVVTDAGAVHSGVLLEESGLTLSLGQSNGLRVDIPKASIDERRTIPKSAMPELAEHLSPGEVADLTTFLLSMREPPLLSASPSTTASTGRTAGGFTVDERKDRLAISLDGRPIVDFIFRDEKILRPFFANARLIDGRQVTRTHPPVPGVDSLDHDTMHPGIWLGFGDISQQDYWRNKASIEHVRFVSPPKAEQDRVRFATECRLRTAGGEPLGGVTHEFTVAARPTGWLLVWRAAFRAEQRPLVFGDQEEMGFGARVATPFIEKNGGVVRSSAGKTTAKNTWGQAARWCDYSGSGPQSGGIMLMASPGNFRESWWHNRDYGVFVANPFGRSAMKQGDRSAVAVAPGETFRIAFGALVHDHRAVVADAEYAAFQQLVSE